MPFSEQERAALLALKGVGPTVVKRFEEIGIDSFEQLAGFNANTITERVASMLQTSCWKNSPQAKAAINAAITRAKQG
ncbi:helix-hairpin-helix domain-containing protein [Pseudoalteromonas lipolytica]|uniref:helix-hairpin-helix domain-containing protein n=1 Tax=Pseudoalteromonas lipolytica TaxID=570156 RepID=UPI0024203F93|nr:helix-hairpin-helix domain-containing protein [Pseudoalteromonas lipolytica]|tara:strand:- start:7410 stop:7643 length:234 start_codon:yes stop_codon:yes gene_type:complete